MHEAVIVGNVGVEGVTLAGAVGAHGGIVAAADRIAVSSQD